MNVNGINDELYQAYSERQWRLLTHPRSGATGVYGRDGTLVPNYPINQHRAMVAKGFVLVQIENIAGALTGPWVSEVE